MAVNSDHMNWIINLPSQPTKSEQHTESGQNAARHFCDSIRNHVLDSDTQTDGVLGYVLRSKTPGAAFYIGKLSIRIIQHSYL